jgi:micrococcal nuclease
MPPPTPTATETATPTPVLGVRLGDLRFDGDVPQVESDEYIEIVNDGPERNVAGWQLEDDDGNAFIFPDHVMAQGDACRVYTDESHPEFCGFSFNSPEAIWDNGGDMVILRNAAGDVVETKCWNRGC